MLRLVLEYVRHGLRSAWKLYATNILCLVVVLFLFSYLEGARRQLDRRSTVFSGEAVVMLKRPILGADAILLGLSGVRSLSKKVRSAVSFAAPGSDARGEAELIGTQLRPGKDFDAPLAAWLELVSGAYPQGDDEILVPDTLLADFGLKVGDFIAVQGRISDRRLNAAVFKISGAYRSSEVGLFEPQELIVSDAAMASFYLPGPQDIEYCLFFKGGSAPADINALVSRAFDDPGKTKVRSVISGKVSVFDVLNISVQFNVFFVIVIFLAIAVMASIIVVVNFNIFTITFRRRRKELGTLMAFGSSRLTVAAVFALESLAQVLICVVLATGLTLALSLVLGRIDTWGSLELLQTLLSGTDRVVLILTPGHVRDCFLLLAGAVAVAQTPVILGLLVGEPASFLQDRR